MSQAIENLDEVLKTHKLSKEEYQDVLRILEGRHPNIVEIGIFSAMWSEHCSYKSNINVHRFHAQTASWWPF